MENGFSFELYGTVFENCFVMSSRYKNGNLQLSLFGSNPEMNGETTHFADITLNQNRVKLKPNEIVVDCTYKPEMIPQLQELGIIKKQTGICAVNSCIYPIYTIDLDIIAKKEYYMPELICA